MQQMDLMVSVGSAKAHLAGALGLPTVALLPHQTDWYWMDEKTNNTWYPTVEILQQEKIGEWVGTLERCSALIHQRFCSIN